MGSLNKKRKRKNKAEDTVTPKKPRTTDSGRPGESLIADASNDENSKHPLKPEILRHLFIGINEVTRRLEAQVQEARLQFKLSTEKTEMCSRPQIEVLFVCNDDIDPPIFVSHLPHLVAAYNSVKNVNPIKAITLPKGSEAKLAAATGLRRLAVVGIDAYPPLMDTIRDLLDVVPVLTAPWLLPHMPALIPTHIEQVRTSAPADMKASKEKRAESRRAAKERRKLSRTLHAS